MLLRTLVLLLLTAAPALAQKPLEETLKTFTVADGLQLELFASEPMFSNPTCFDIDHKGRVWVCESVNYRTRLHKKPLNRKEGDRIVVLEDTDGDGQADKAHTFYQDPEFIAPLGIAIAPYPDGKGQKVYVCHSPHIYVFDDKDGDLKADGKPTILLTGFKGYDHDHGVHGIHFGPDGKLYFSVGDAGVENLQANDGKGRKWTTNKTDCQAGTIWRCDPDGSNLELLAHNFRNPYEPAVNSFGTLFTSDNDDDGSQQTRICYVMYGGNYGYWPRGKGESHWHEEQPGVVHKVLRTGFGSPTGMGWYEGEALRSSLLALGKDKGKDKNIEGLLLHTDAGPREVRCFIVKSKGAGYELEKIDLVTSSDNWFRPSDVCVAPDGSIFVADWYDPGVGGHGMGDTERGRIYRISAKDKKGYHPPAVDLKDRSGIVAALHSPATAVRMLAFAKLLDLGPKDAVKHLETLVAFGKADAVLRARCVWLLLAASRKYSDTPAYLAAAATPREILDPKFAVLSLRAFNPLSVLRDSDATVQELLKAGGAAAYREALVGLRLLDTEKSRDLVLNFAQRYDGQDHFYLAAINIAVGSDPERRKAILADFEKHFPEWNDKVARLVRELRPPAAMKLVDKGILDEKAPEKQRAQMAEVLAGFDDESAGRLLLQLLAQGPPDGLRDVAVQALKTHLPAKWKTLQDSDELRAAVSALHEKEHYIACFELAAAGQYPLFAKRLTVAAENPKLAREVRLSAVRNLTAFSDPNVVPHIVAFLEEKVQDEVIGGEAVAALGRIANKEALEALQKLQGDAKAAMEKRREAVVALSSSRPGSVWLLDAHARKELPEVLVPDVGRLLRNSPHQDLRNRALIAFPAPGKIDPKKLPPVSRLVNRKGDLAHGRQLFLTHKDLGCARCHTVRGVGGQIGPDLSMVGKKASRENLFESILEPDKAIADQFIQARILNNDGQIIIGLVVEETPDHLILRDAQGKDTKLLKSEIKQREKSSKSIMPDDLLAFLTEDDLVDLVEYLETLKTPALAVDAWHIAGPFDNIQADEGLDKKHPPEEKIDLSARYPGKHGEIGWRTVRPDAGGYVDLRAFHGGKGDQIVSYLYREIDSPVEQDAVILLGTDDGVRLWVNGEMVLSHNRHEAAVPEKDAVPVKLRKGKNAILLKINNGDGPHGLYFTVTSQEELKLTPLR